jgi:ribosomal protein S12 methylthiotransferase
MAQQPKICRYLDIPLQHASDSVLERMRRQTTQHEQRELIQYARNKVKGIAIRTTFLVGFPGENEEEFEDLCRFVEEMQFDRVGVFQYSHEEDTSGFLLADDVHPDVKTDRANKIMEIQQDISLQHNQKRVGSVFKVLFDRKEGSYFIGRTEFDSPEVDNEVLVDAEKYFIRLGDFAWVKIGSAEDYDLFGEVIEGPQ